MKRHLKIVPEDSPQGLTALSDDDLMRLLRRGSERAFQLLIQRHQTLVLGYTTRFLGDRSQAREITQEVFLALWGERQDYRAQGQFRSYLMTLAFHRCQTAARQKKSAATKLERLSSEPTALTEPPTPLDQLLAKERAAEVHALLLEVDERTRSALTLRFANGLSYQEIAKISGQPQGTVKAQVSRGIRRLHDIWLEGRAP